MRIGTTVLLALLASAALSACEAPQSLHPSFGESVRHNKQAHIINPGSLPASTPPPSMHGPRAANAMGYYEASDVEDIKRPSTSSLGAQEE